MDGLNQESVASRIEIPPFHGPRIITFFYVTIVFFVALAFFHLSQFYTTSWPTLLAAAVWLLFVFSSLRWSIDDDGGVRQWWHIRLSDVSRRRFVETVTFDEETLIVRFGCRLFGWRSYVLDIPANAISSVEWDTGQATGRAGIDMNDWAVMIWYHQPNRSKAKRYPWVRDEQLHIATGMASRNNVEPFGQTLVAFLQDAGVTLKPTENSTEFTSTGKSIRNEMGRRYQLWSEKQRSEVERELTG